MPTQESPLIKRMPSKAQKKQKAQKHQPLQLQLPQPTNHNQLTTTNYPQLIPPFWTPSPLRFQVTQSLVPCDLCRPFPRPNFAPTRPKASPSDRWDDWEMMRIRCGFFFSPEGHDATGVGWGVLVFCCYMCLYKFPFLKGKKDLQLKA